jgi:hypothetical protein
LDCDDVPELLEPPPLLLPPLGGGLFAGGLLLLLLVGGPDVFGLGVGHLPLESGCDPSGHVVCVVGGGVDVDCGLLVVLHVELSVPGPHPATAVGGVPMLLLGFVAFIAGLIVPGGILNMLTGGARTGLRLDRNLRCGIQ